MSVSESTEGAVPAHAGVWFPPPFVYAAGILAGWLLQRWRPLPITAGASAIRIGVSLVFTAGWLIVTVGAFSAFRRARTTIIPNKPAAAMVRDGPYAWTRNPMYVGLVSLYAAAALWLNSWWAMALLPVVVLVIDRAVIAREERYLAAAFPAEYAAFRAHVRRWI